jgi:radial spoke head protein 9
VNLEDSLEIPKNLPGKNFSELERLSLIVNTVDYQCGLVPVGALKLTPTHEILLNVNFKGLSLSQSLSVENYQHFRLPLSEQKREFIGKI